MVEYIRMAIGWPDEGLVELLAKRGRHFGGRPRDRLLQDRLHRAGETGSASSNDRGTGRARACASGGGRSTASAHACARENDGSTGRARASARGAGAPAEITTKA